MATAGVAALVKNIRQGNLTVYSWLALVVGGCLIGGLWLFVALQLNYDYDRTLADAGRETMNLAVGFEEHVRGALSQADNDLDCVRQLYERDGGVSPAVAALMANSARNQAMTQLVILDERGKPVASLDERAMTVDFSDREYYRFFLDNTGDQLYIGKPMVGRVSGVPTIPLSRRLSKADGSFGGIVYVGLKTDYFLSFYSKMDFGENQLITLAGLDGVVRARQSGKYLEVGQDMKSSRLWENVQAGRAAGTYVTADALDGLSRVMSFRVMPDYPLVFNVGKTTQAAFAAYEQRKRGYLGGALVACLFILGFFGLLVDRFEKQKALNVHLEQIVQERTEQVAMQHEELQAQNEELQAQHEELLAQNEELQARETELLAINDQLVEMETAVRRHAARMAATNDELAATNAELKSFADIVAHDFRTPMVNLKGFSQELGLSLAELRQVVHDELAGLPAKVQAKVDELLDKEVPDAQRFIDTAVDRLNRMIEALLELARLGRRELRFKEVDTAAVVEAVLRSHSRLFDDKGIEVTRGTLPTLVSDQLAIEQIIGNLVDNAVKYLRPDVPGKISITCSERDDEYLWLVEDNGRGVAAADCEKIFDIFRRSGVQDVPGEGMGLAYVRTLVRLLGGKVWCEPAAEAGTRFYFTLPKKRD